MFVTVNTSPIFVSDEIGAQNTFSRPAQVKGDYVLSLKGTWSATVTIQRSNDLSTWEDITDNSGNVISFTSNGTYGLNEPAALTFIRWGVKTADYTSGTVEGSIAQ